MRNFAPGEGRPNSADAYLTFVRKPLRKHLLDENGMCACVGEPKDALLAWLATGGRTAARF